MHPAEAHHSLGIEHVSATFAPLLMERPSSRMMTIDGALIHLNPPISDNDFVQNRSRGDETYLLTAYTLDKESTGKSPEAPGFGITATGQPAVVGRTIAVDPHVIPYGSLVYIEGIGVRVAEDTGGAIHGHHIDILMDSRNHALQFGVRRKQHVRLLALPHQRMNALLR